MKVKSTPILSCLLLLMRDTQAFKHDYYNTLGLEAVATETEIKLAFRQLALKFHPDKNPDSEAEQKFHDITEAYEVLRDPEKRRSYDDTMAQNRFKSESESRQKYAIVDQLLRNVLTYLSNPWALLILAFLLYKIYGKIKERFLMPIYYRYEDWCEQRKIDEEAALMKKNPDEYREKMEAMERARLKLQEHYQRSTEAWAEKQIALEEKKRQQDIEDWEGHLKGEGYKSRYKTGEDKAREALEQQARVKGKKGFKPEYNPLMGMGGGGSGFRPSRRTGGGGGG